MEQTELLKCQEAMEHRHKLHKLHCHQVLDETTWHKIAMGGKKVSSFMTCTHPKIIIPVFPPSPTVTFVHSIHPPLRAHFLI